MCPQSPDAIYALFAFALVPSLLGWSAVVVLFTIAGAAAGALARVVGRSDHGRHLTVASAVVLVVFAASLSVRRHALLSMASAQEEARVSGRSEPCLRLWFGFDEKQRDSCFGAAAVTAGDARLCEPIETPATRCDCLQQIAGRTSDVSICKSMPAGTCRDYCIVAAARGAGTAEVCELVSGSYPRAECQIDVAEATRDVGLCRLIEVDRVRDGCLRIVAILLSTPEVCAEIESAEERAACVQGTSGRDGH